MKKKFNSYNLKFLKFFDQRDMGSIPRIFLSSFLVVFFFYCAPIFINFLNNQNVEFQNNSKAILAYTLNNEGNEGAANNQILDEKDLLVDIFSLNDLETDTVRLIAATLKQ